MPFQKGNRYGSLINRRGKNNPMWKGGRRIDKDGYVLVHRPDHPKKLTHNYVHEHRLILELHLGRLLTSDEIVHHINHDKTDNRIENLKIINHFDHKRIHDEERLEQQRLNPKRRCGKCKNWLLKKLFGKANRFKLGLSSVCLQCERKRDADRRKRKCLKNRNVLRSGWW